MWQRPFHNKSYFHYFQGIYDKRFLITDAITQIENQAQNENSQSSNRKLDEPDVSTGATTGDPNEGLTDSEPVSGNSAATMRMGTQEQEHEIEINMNATVIDVEMTSENESETPQEATGSQKQDNESHTDGNTWNRCCAVS